MCRENVDKLMKTKRSGESASRGGTVPSTANEERRNGKRNVASTADRTGASRCTCLTRPRNSYRQHSGRMSTVWSGYREPSRLPKGHSGPLSDGPTHACSPHARPIATSARLKARLRRRYPRARTCDTRDTCANTTSGRLGSHGHAQTHATSSACRGWVAGGSLCADAGSRESARYTWMIERWRDGLERTVASDTPGARAARWRPQG